MSRRIPTNLSNLSVCYQVNFEFFYLIGSIKSNLRCVISRLTINSHRKQPP
ncbi:unnamed protein product [Arabidopsis halleri]